MTMIRYILAGTFLATPIAAQSTDQQCAPSAQAYEALTSKYGERMLVTGHMENGAAVEFWLNPLASSWTALVTNEGMSCLLADGKEWTLDAPKQGEDM